MEYQVRKLFRSNWAKVYTRQPTEPFLKFVRYSKAQFYNFRNPHELLQITFGSVKRMNDYIQAFCSWIGIKKPNNSWYIAANEEWIGAFDQYERLVAYLKHTPSGKIVKSGEVKCLTQIGEIRVKRGDLVVYWKNFKFSKSNNFIHAKNQETGTIYTYTYNHGQVRLFTMVDKGREYPLDTFRFWFCQKIYGRDIGKIIALKIIWSRSVSIKLVRTVAESKLLLISPWVYTGHWLTELPNIIRQGEYQLAKMLIESHNTLLDREEVQKVINQELLKKLQIQVSPDTEKMRITKIKSLTDLSLMLT